MRYYFENQREGRFKMLDYYKGMDISFLQEYLEKGMKTYDLDGTLIDPLKLAKKHGVNAMRLRIWHTPENVPESGGYCSLERTIVMAKKICIWMQLTQETARRHRNGWMSFMKHFRSLKSGWIHCR